MGEIMTQNQFQKVKDTMKETVNNISKKMPTLDKEAMMNSHKKNMEALTEANKMAVEVMKSLAHLQSQYVKQTFEDMTSLMRERLANPKPSKEAVEKHSNHIKDQVQKAFDHGANITSTLAKSQKEIFDLMHARYHESATSAFEAQEKNISKTKH
jgi:phasin family protein